MMAIYCGGCDRLQMVLRPPWWHGLHYTFTCPECGADGEGNL